MIKIEDKGEVFWKYTEEEHASAQEAEEFKKWCKTKFGGMQNVF